MPPACLVKWHDTVSYNGTWASQDEAQGLEPSLMHTLGWIVGESDSHITIASTRSHDDEDCLGDLNAIPRGCILSITTVQMA